MQDTVYRVSGRKGLVLRMLSQRQGKTAIEVHSAKYHDTRHITPSGRTTRGDFSACPSAGCIYNL